MFRRRKDDRDISSMALDGRVTETIFDFSDPEVGVTAVRGLRVLPNGPMFWLDDCRIENQIKRVLIIGAEPGCDIVLEDDAVSGLHCLIERHTYHLLVHDCQSKNGTRVNGALVKVGELVPGTLLTVGRKTLVVNGPHFQENRIVIAAASFQEFLFNAVDAYGSVRSAADAVGLPYSTLRGWLANKYARSDLAKGSSGPE